MKYIIPFWLFCLVITTPFAGAESTRKSAAARPSANTATVSPAKNETPDSRQMEKDLQRLPWKQFKSVIESIPQLKAGIEAYGPIGWQYVKANYTTYGWKRNIDKLDVPQKKRLAELIASAKGSR